MKCNKLCNHVMHYTCTGRGGVTLAIGRGTSHLDVHRGPLTQLAPLFVWHPPVLGACTHLCWTWHGGGDGVVCLLHVVLYDMQTVALIRRKLLLVSLVSGLMTDHLQRRGLFRVYVCVMVHLHAWTYVRMPDGYTVQSHTTYNSMHLHVQYVQLSVN